MKNKKLSVDERLKRIFPAGMREGLQVIIELKCGFETFGAYETWNNGYYVTVPAREPSSGWVNPNDNLGRREIKVQAEILEVAVKELEQKMNNLVQCPNCSYLTDYLTSEKLCRHCYLETREKKYMVKDKSWK